MNATDRTEQAVDHLTPSGLIWAIMAVTGLWLVGLFILAVGYTLTECLGAVCEEPAPRGVWWGAVALAGLTFAWSGRVATRMTHVTWTWAAAVPGLLFLLIVSL